MMVFLFGWVFVAVGGLRVELLGGTGGSLDSNTTTQPPQGNGGSLDSNTTTQPPQGNGGSVDSNTTTQPPQGTGGSLDSNTTTQPPQSTDGSEFSSAQPSVATPIKEGSSEDTFWSDIWSHVPQKPKTLHENAAAQKVSTWNLSILIWGFAVASVVIVGVALALWRFL